MYICVFSNKFNIYTYTIYNKIVNILTNLIAANKLKDFPKVKNDNAIYKSNFYKMSINDA